MPNEITVRIIPHDEVLSLREEVKLLNKRCDTLRAERDDAQMKYASECHINMALQDELKELKNQLKKGNKYHV